MTLEEAYKQIKASYIHHSGEKNAVFLPQAEKIAMECIQRMIDVEKAKQCNINHYMSFEAYYCYIQDLVTSAHERLERTLNYGETNEYRLAELKSAIKLEEQLLGYMTELKEAKRLLKSATNVLSRFIQCDEDYCSECIKQRQNCDYDDRFKWRYLDEALKLLNDEK